MADLGGGTPGPCPPPPFETLKKKKKKKCVGTQKCVGFPPPPPPPRSWAFLGLARLSRLAAVRKKQCVVPPPPFFFNPGSAPASMYVHVVLNFNSCRIRTCILCLSDSSDIKTWAITHQRERKICKRKLIPLINRCCCSYDLIFVLGYKISIEQLNRFSDNFNHCNKFQTLMRILGYYVQLLCSPENWKLLQCTLINCEKTIVFANIYCGTS